MMGICYGTRPGGGVVILQAHLTLVTLRRSGSLFVLPIVSNQHAGYLLYILIYIYHLM